MKRVDQKQKKKIDRSQIKKKINNARIRNFGRKIENISLRRENVLSNVLKVENLEWIITYFKVL